jgi:hypothetical protein
VLGCDWPPVIAKCAFSVGDYVCLELVQHEDADDFAEPSAARFGVRRKTLPYDGLSRSPAEPSSDIFEKREIDSRLQQQVAEVLLDLRRGSLSLR